MPKRILFNNPVFTRFYHLCKDFIYENKFYEVYRLENNKNESVLILFNFYRYTKKHKTGQIKVEYWCLKSQKWKRERAKKKLKYCYTIPFLNLSLNYLFYVQENVIIKIVEYLRIKHPEYKELSSYFISTLIDLLKKYLHHRTIIFRNAPNHTKHITKWLWQYFWDKSIISAVFRIEGYGAHLGHYLFYQKHIAKLARVSREYPNLLPLLSQIKPTYWDDPNLFSYDYWVNKSSRSREFRSPVYCETKQQWRWIKKQSSKFIRVWLQQNRDCRGYILSVLMQPGVSEKLPVCLQIMIFMSGRILEEQYISEQNKQRLLRLFIRYALDFWKNRGIRELRSYLKNDAIEELQDIATYLSSNEGGRRGLPPTWEHLIERNEQWHRQLIEELQRRKDEEHQQQLAKFWDSNVSYYKIDEVEFTALTTGKALYEEGQRMNHCIFTYTDLCDAGRYLAFSVKHNYKDKNVKPYYSTLGLCLSGQGKNQKWLIDQHRGRYNESVAPYLKKIAQQFCRVLNQQYSF
ncbi:PcfJ domain-containing protein [Gallibacterium anatis]|uniref:PcfJ domain-containing protein n=1 Tax=Gallibacterium anatis TaxID=750 RepID=A0AAX3XDA2_9PAST|nr:PcfJ domain-containing protein [Gallibacterium anatis]MDK9560760.1 PcfJ domain-containing protein [Gallibacterium anatis]WIM80174.1 PcfJ domain-containing protein [Gallibacterium anatis]